MGEATMNENPGGIRRCLFAAGMMAALLAGACQPAASNLSPAATPSEAPAAAAVKPPTGSATLFPPGEAKILEPEGFVQQTHDPVIAKEGDTYYVFSTGSRIPIRCSKDLVQWEFCGRVFKENPQWVVDAVPGVTDLWAPDISHFGGRWHLYYAASTFGKNRSVIGLTTNATLDSNSPQYGWVDEGEVIASTPADDWNAIDPNLAFDRDGQPWLAFGSFWSGIKLRKIDALTGKPSADDTQLYGIAGRSRSGGAPGAIEAPFIVRRGDFFYLFVSFDFCCRGVDSNYNIRVGRSKEITGPYVDRDGKKLLDGGGTLVLAGGERWRGPGHNAIYVEGDTYWLVYHAYDAQEIGVPKLRIEALIWGKDGWPSASSPSQSAQ